MSFGSPGAYPTPANGGPQYLKFRQFQPDWEVVTDAHEYEDGGRSWVAYNDSAPIFFIFEYDGLDVADAEDLYGHFSDAGGQLFGFTLTNPRTETEFTDVHYAPDGWEEDHTMVDINRVRIRLVKYPA